MARPRIVVADDHDKTRGAIASLLASEGEDLAQRVSHRQNKRDGWTEFFEPSSSGRLLTN